MLGYWGDQEKTEEVIGMDRWFHTGSVQWILLLLMHLLLLLLLLLLLPLPLLLHLLLLLLLFFYRDVAVIDSAGYGQIVGRMKDMIIRGGENIYPR